MYAELGIVLFQCNVAIFMTTVKAAFTFFAGVADAICCLPGFSNATIRASLCSSCNTRHQCLAKLNVSVAGFELHDGIREQSLIHLTVEDGPYLESTRWF